MNIGFIGLGNMGGAIAERLLSQGVALHVYDPDRAAMDRAQALGATSQPDVKSVANIAEVVFACLPSVAIATEVSQGADGVARGAAVRTYIELSTIGPVAARSNAAGLKAHDIVMIDAAVSGGAAAARAGTLAIMMAAPPDAILRVRSLVEHISDRIFVIGAAPGLAQQMKLINNILAAANIATSFEALVLGTKLGLDPATMINVINAGSGRSTGLADSRVRAILDRSFDSGPRIGLLTKDVQLLMDSAVVGDFPMDAMPSLQGVADLWAKAHAAGMDEEDVSALITLIEKRAGVEVRHREP